MSSRTPRVMTPAAAASIALRSAPNEVTSARGRPLYIESPSKTWQRAARCVTE